MSAPVRLSVMGAGLIGKRHIEHILARPEAVLSSIVDPMPAARELAVLLNVDWFPSFQDCSPKIGQTGWCTGSLPSLVAWRRCC